MQKGYEMSLKKIILGSASPRRRELLDILGYSYSVVRPDVEEVRQPGEAPLAYAKRNAQTKALAIWDRLRGDEREANKELVIISADTIVVLGDVVLEKPENDSEARRMLQQLSGKTHTVITACALAHGGGVKANLTQFHVETAVTFTPLSPATLDWYVAKGESLDKAGGYAAQGFGSRLIARVDGSYTNVIGLPLVEVADALQALGV